MPTAAAAAAAAAKQHIVERHCLLLWRLRLQLLVMCVGAHLESFACCAPPTCIFTFTINISPVDVKYNSTAPAREG